MFEWLGETLGRGMRHLAGYFMHYFAIPLMDYLGNKIASKVKPFLDDTKIKDNVPDSLKPFFEELGTPTGEIGALLGQSAGSSLIGGALGKLIDAALLPAAYAYNAVTENVIMAPAEYLSLWLRGDINDATLDEYLSAHGYDELRVTQWKQLARVYLTPEFAVRFKWRYGWDQKSYLAYQKTHGLEPEDVGKLEAVMRYYPSPQDLVLWQAREVFEPEMVEKYGLDSELETVEKEPFYKAGMDDEQIRNHWRAHWQHASYSQVVEMLHRTDLTEEDMWEWFRVVEIPPYWRQRLIDIAYTPYTRVDVRRMWDIGVLEDGEVITAYQELGYTKEKATRMLAFTKLFQRAPDLRARFKKGWIGREQLLAELKAFGLSDRLAQMQLETLVQADQADRTEKERDLTKADIYRGVKKGTIFWEQGVELLQDMGYDAWEADYILRINVPTGETDTEVKQKELTKSDIKAAIKGLIIDPSEGISRLVGLRYSQSDAEFLMTIYESLIPMESIEGERDLSKSDILIALREGILSPNEAHVMLVDLRYSPDDADTLIAANMPSPEQIAEEANRQVAKSDIKSALRTELITPSEAYQRLIGIGYETQDASFLIDTYLMLEALKHVTKPRELTKADITKGVKQGLLSREEGYMLLIELGYPEAEANYLLELTIEAIARSPVNFQEFKVATQGFRQATGQEAKVPSAELIEAEREVRRLRAKIASMRRRNVAEEDIGPVIGLLGSMEVRYRGLLIEHEK